MDKGVYSFPFVHSFMHLFVHMFICPSVVLVNICVKVFEKSLLRFVYALALAWGIHVCDPLVTLSSFAISIQT